MCIYVSPIAIVLKHSYNINIAYIKLELVRNIQTTSLKISPKEKEEKAKPSKTTLEKCRKVY